MNKQDFETLLTDIYQIYNPAKIKDIQFTIDKYNGREFDAVKTAFIFYNNKFNPNFNAELNTDDYINRLIRKYSEGERVLAKDVSDKKKTDEQVILQKQKEEEERKLKEKAEQEKALTDHLKKEGSEIKSDIEKAVNSKVEEYLSIKKKEIDSMLQEKLKQESKKIEEYFKKKLEDIPNLINEITDKKIQSSDLVKKGDLKIEVKITTMNFGEADLQLPGEDIMKNVSIGQRMVVYDSEQRICGLEVKDITDDNVSFEGVCIREVSIMKLD